VHRLARILWQDPCPSPAQLPKPHPRGIRQTGGKPVGPIARRSGPGKRRPTKTGRFPAQREKGHEELKWASRAENGNRRIATARAIAGKQPERAWQVWIRVHLGGERRIDVARACRYKHGSAITHILKKLQTEARSKPATAKRMARLQTEIDQIPSSFKS